MWNSVSEAASGRDPPVGKIFLGENSDKFIILGDNPNGEFTSFFLVNSVTGGFRVRVRVRVNG